LVGTTNYMRHGVGGKASRVKKIGSQGKRDSRFNREIVLKLKK